MQPAQRAGGGGGHLEAVEALVLGPLPYLSLACAPPAPWLPCPLATGPQHHSPLLKGSTAQLLRTAFSKAPLISFSPPPASPSAHQASGSGRPSQPCPHGPWSLLRDSQDTLAWDEPPPSGSGRFPLSSSNTFKTLKTPCSSLSSCTSGPHPRSPHNSVISWAFCCGRLRLEGPSHPDV